MEELFAQVKTSAQLFTEQGLSPSTISRLCSRGRLRRIARNTYVDAHIWQGWNHNTRFLALHAGFLLNFPNCVLSHSSAALWWGAPLLQQPEKIWVSHPGKKARSRTGVRVSSGREQVCQQALFYRGARLTSPLQTALDCASSLPLLEALCIMDFFLHQRSFSAQQVEIALQDYSGQGRQRARQVAELMSGLAESPAETIARYRIASWGFSPPQEQGQVRVGHRVYRVDFLWEEFKVILEVDGSIKYDGRFGDPAQVVRREKLRQRDLERLGYRVLRVMWDDLTRFPENLRSLLVQAGVR